MTSSIYGRFVKRLFDFILSFIGLIICSPVLLVIVIVIHIDNPGPALFVQQRVGLREKPFSILKFRTMVVNAQSMGSSTQANDNRITRSGRILRKLSLDELPQLLNVLSGSMSLIGPRPDLQSLMMTDNKDYMERFKVKPGITGLAQASGRSELTVEQRIALDKQYANNVSFPQDVKIIFMTIKHVLFRTGTN